jgi:hypothetical protein
VPLCSFTLWRRALIDKVPILRARRLAGTLLAPQLAGQKSIGQQPKLTREEAASVLALGKRVACKLAWMFSMLIASMPCHVDETLTVPDARRLPYM